MKFLSEASLWKPNFTTRSTWLEHAPFAFWLIENHRPDGLVELGSGDCFSYFSFCQAIGRCDLETKAFAVNSWSSESLNSHAFLQLEAHHKRYKSFSALVDTSYDQAILQFQDGSVDLLNVCGASACSELKTNFESWRAKLSKKALLLIHGFNSRTDGVMAKQLWSELCVHYPSFQFTHGNGLGILKIGSGIAPAIDELFSLSAAQAREVRATYTRLGRVLSHDQDTVQRIDDYERRLAEFTLKLQHAEEVNRCNVAAFKREQQGAERQFYDYERQLEEISLKAEVTYRELRRAHKHPLRNWQRYMRWRTSKWLQRLRPVVSEKFVERMRRRQRKNEPGALTFIGGTPASGKTPANAPKDRRHRWKRRTSRLILKVPFLPAKVRKRVERRLEKHSKKPAHLWTSHAKFQPPVRETQDKILGAALSIDQKYKVVLGLVTFNNDEFTLSRLVRSAEVCSARVGENIDLELMVIDNGAPSVLPTSSLPIRRLTSMGNVGFASAQNRLLKAAFAEGAELYIAVNPDGIFHPDCVKHLLQMSIASEHQSVIEALQFPAEHPKVYDLNTFDAEWVTGACLLIPKKVYDAVGGFDDEFFLYCEDVDFSWRVRVAGFTVKTNPRALFFHDITRGRPNPVVYQEMLKSGVKLAKKWRAPDFEQSLISEMKERDVQIPPANVAAIQGDVSFCDFSRRFHFSEVRWES